MGPLWPLLLHATNMADFTETTELMEELTVRVLLLMRARVSHPDPLGPH